MMADGTWQRMGDRDAENRQSSGRFETYDDYQGEADPIPITATPFVWRDPLTIPPRPWVYGRHMIRKQVSVTVAPGGVGKSSLTLVEALAIVTGRKLLGEWVSETPLRAWVYNLEDPRDEMDRRVIAAMMHHDIAPEAMGERLFIDTGRERALCTAIEVQGSVTIVKPEMDALAAEITRRGIDVLIVDPFVSSHRVSENASGAIDLVAKEWARLADRCNCAIELVHHTRKTNGAEATSEDGRGSSALLAAARSGRVLNKMNDEMKDSAGVKADLATYFGIDRDKANLAPAGNRIWVRMASVDLGQGDSVGVAESWTWPDTFDGVSVADLLRVQQAIEGKQPRYSDQSGDEWVATLSGRKPKPWTRTAHLPAPVWAAIANIPSTRKPDEQVFQYFEAGNVKQAWDSAVVRAGIARLTPHSCRHGFATTLLRAGTDPKTVATMGGWKDVATVMKYYAHAVNDPTVTDALFGTNLTQGQDAQPVTIRKQTRKKA